MSIYKHHPIDLATDAIRLVRLRKGYSADKIRCELFDAFLHQIDGVPYEALSYNWGDVANSVDINVDGNGVLPVTGNLYMALHCLRLSDQDRILWIDAICINQNNDEEKGHQVRHMRLIYEHAERVLIWLGRSSDDTDLLMEMMQKLDKRVVRNVFACSKSPVGWKAEWLALLNECGGTKTDFYRRRCRALAELLQRPWFKRVWVLQEAASAKRADVVVGWRSIPTRAFVMAPSLMEMTCEKHTQAVLDIMPGPLRPHSWWNENRSLNTLIGAFSNSDASDHRDKLYALYGISSDAQDGETLRPDYGVPLEHAIRDVISFLIFRRVLDHSVYVFPDWSLYYLVRNLEQLPRQLFAWALTDTVRPIAFEMINGEALGVDQETMKNIKEEALLDLAKSGLHQNVVEAILDSGVDPNVQRLGETPLNIATRHGKNEIVQLLLQQEDIDLNHRDSDRLTPLCSAVRQERYNVVETILSHKDVLVNTASGRVISTPLWLAAEKGNQILVQLLLDKGAEAEIWNSIKSRSVLGIAIEKGHLGIVDRLLQSHANATSKNYDASETPPPTPATEVELDMSEQANSAHASLGSKSLYSGQTPLVLAAQYGHAHIVQHVINRGSSLDSADSSGRTALSWAAADGSVEVVRILVKYSSALNHRDNDGRTPLALAAQNGHAKVARVLADSGVELNCQDLRGRTPLATAAKLWHMTVIKVLLEKGCDISIPDFSGKTPLKLAKSEGKPCRKETEIVNMIKGKEWQDHLASRKKGL